MKLFKKNKKELTEDEIIEKELENELGDDNPFNFKELLRMMKTKTDEDIEYESLLTEEEKLEELKEKEDSKKYLIKATSILFLILSVIIIVGVFILEENKGELYKITEPMLKEYYKNKYNKKASFKSINKLVIDNKETNIVLATTKDDKHIMTIDNKLIGDDISNKVNKELSKILEDKLANLNILNSEFTLAYKDYYPEYNKKLDYINVIPDQSLDDLLKSKKLTVEYVAFYSGVMDNNLVLEILNDFSDDSKFYFIKLDNGLPTELDIIDKNNQFNNNITGNKEVENGIFTYNIDRTYNAVNSVKFSRFADSELESYPKHTLKNIFKIELESDYSYQKDKRIGNYFLIKMNSLNKNNLYQVEYSENDRTYFEVDIKSYNNFIITSFGGYTYLIGDNEVTFGSLEENKSFLCNLGLC